MTSLSFPDVNVWLAVISPDHPHRPVARNWWESTNSERIGFTRITQISVLRLLRTPAVMNGRPRTMDQAWHAYDRLFEDSRVCFEPEPPDFDVHFRRYSHARSASPKVWADPYLLAFCGCHQAQLITFDRALADRGVDCRMLA